MLHWYLTISVFPFTQSATAKDCGFDKHTDLMYGHMQLSKANRIRKLQMKLPGDIDYMLYSLFAKVEHGVGNSFLSEVLENLNADYIDNTRMVEASERAYLGSIAQSYMDMVDTWPNKVLVSYTYEKGPMMNQLRSGERNKRLVPETDLVSMYEVIRNSTD